MLALPSRRAFLSLTLALCAAPAFAQTAPRIEVAKTPTCGCCAAWIDHMRAAGFDVTARDVTQGALARIKAQTGLTPELASCHTAMVEGYVVEGHVPAADVRRLLDERPDALGLTVPGMPIGSPGMEMGDARDAYDVLLVRRDGGATVFSAYR
jgi:hypothetical protein